MIVTPNVSFSFQYGYMFIQVPNTNLNNNTEKYHHGHYRLSMECMRILHTQDPITFQRLRNQYNLVEEQPHHDGDMNELLDDWFQE